MIFRQVLWFTPLKRAELILLRTYSVPARDFIIDFTPAMGQNVVASALIVRNLAEIPLTFITADRKQFEAARELELVSLFT